MVVLETRRRRPNNAGCTLGMALAVHPFHHPRQTPAASFVASKHIAAILALLVIALAVLALTSFTLFAGCAGGGLVGCILAGLYCCGRDRRKRRQ